jgi:ATP-dependent DNA ligase
MADGYRLMVRREGARVRLWTRGGYDWAERFPRYENGD